MEIVAKTSIHTAYLLPQALINAVNYEHRGYGRLTSEKRQYFCHHPIKKRKWITKQTRICLKCGRVLKTLPKRSMEQIRKGWANHTDNYCDLSDYSLEKFCGKKYWRNFSV